MSILLLLLLLSCISILSCIRIRISISIHIWLSGVCLLFLLLLLLLTVRLYILFRFYIYVRVSVISIYIVIINVNLHVVAVSFCLFWCWCWWLAAGTWICIYFRFSIHVSIYIYISPWVWGWGWWRWWNIVTDFTICLSSTFNFRSLFCIRLGRRLWNLFIIIINLYIVFYYSLCFRSRLLSSINTNWCIDWFCHCLIIYWLLDCSCIARFYFYCWLAVDAEIIYNFQLFLWLLCTNGNILDHVVCFYYLIWFIL